jgi:hypothetical protein
VPDPGALHQPLSPTLLYACIACGAFLLWSRLARQGRQVLGLSHFLELYINHERYRVKVEPLLFIGIGTFVAAMVIAPITGPQAFAAGLGWTGLLSSAPNSKR